MAKKKNVEVTQESDTGRNEKFKVPGISTELTRTQFVREIESGRCDDNYYVREINGLKTPVSKPDGNKKNNLG